LEFNDCSKPNKEEINNPLFVVYMGLSDQRVEYKRKVYGIMEAMSDTGGFVASLYKSLNVVVYILCTARVNTKLIEIYFSG
jgi:hypothetical protein